MARPVSAGPTAAVEAARAKVSPARLAAMEILLAVGAGRGHSDELLHSARLDALSTEDRNLATALVMGVLRWQIALDARLRGFLQRPEPPPEPVAVALRLGAFQLLHMDRIPPHAALNESVELCRVTGEPQAAGMVNAVLRKLTSAKPPGQPLHESTARFAERLGHPAWLVERWAAAYGCEAAMAVCEYDQREHGAGALFAESDEAVLPVMDDGSRLVAELAAASLQQMEGRAPRVWDCCAAPGGKTLVLVARLPGAEILATDASARRLEAMQARLRGYAYAERVRCAVVDAAAERSVSEMAGPFDLILCDAPCSGTGTLAGNPEIRHRLRLEDLPRQQARQRAILAGALKRLAPGGRLVYSTCSLEPEECEQVVASAAGVRQVAIGPLLAGVSLRLDDAIVQSMIRGNALRTLPGVHPCDGFFAVVLERI